jgi:hypothetical protein
VAELACESWFISEREGKEEERKKEKERERAE